MKREFLMLSHVYDSAKHGVAGWYASEKLDGMRCFYDGGITRGMPALEVPFANTEKDARYIAPPISTGLWTRYGKTIQAPGWWLDRLPPFCLDGELWMGRGRFQDVVSVAKKMNPGDEWRGVRFTVFDSPIPNVVLADGEIKNTNFRKVLRAADFWYYAKLNKMYEGAKGCDFEQVHEWLLKNMEAYSPHVLPQERLPFNTQAARNRVEEMVAEIIAGGGEGIMLRKPSSYWEPIRSHNLLKVKGSQDAEATVIGYTWGRATDLGSKLLGKMGALRCRLDSGREFELSGFTDEEREMEYTDHTLNTKLVLREASDVGADHPGEVVRSDIHNPRFPIGSRVTFTFRELTVEGSPKEARYLRRAE